MESSPIRVLLLHGEAIYFGGAEVQLIRLVEGLGNNSARVTVARVAGSPLAAALPPGLPLTPELRQKLSGPGAPDAGPPRSGADSPKDPDRYRPIPSKYYQAELAGLGFTVKGREQKHDIELSK